VKQQRATKEGSTMPRHDTDDTTDLATGGGEAAALVAQGATLMRIENESMLAVAIQRPRDAKKVLARALEELAILPEEAKEAYYSIPYKERQPDGSTKMVSVEGPSINASSTLARLWGNCSVTARALDEDAAGATIAGIFTDFETNFRQERPLRVSRVKKRRGGGTWTLDPQRWLAEYQAGVSKAQRNATLKGLPAWLVKRYTKAAKAMAAGDPDSKADPKKVAGVLRAFERFKVTAAQLEAYVGAPQGEWLGEHLATLIGLGNALVDKQLTVEEAFEGEPAAVVEVVTPGSLTPDAIARGTASGADEVDAPPPPPSSSAVTREPGQDDDTPPPTACTHPNVPRPIRKGKTVHCPDCTLPVTE
jgi:hypothetical protein